MRAHRAEVLALIPARGGSRGIPRKNLLMVAGKPLIAHSIEHARASGLVTRTIVSTDDAEIADVARRYGAEVPMMRPAEFAGDRSTDLDVFRHALGWLREHEGYACDAVVHLRPTAPVRRVALVDAAVAMLLASPAADSLRSVSLPGQTPYKMWRLSDGWLRPLVELEGIVEAHSRPRQELPPVYWQNGYVDVIRPRTILTLGTMAGHHVLPFVIDDPVPEIDYREDVPALEAALEALALGQWPPAGPGGTRHPI